jgi:hypothetical protein
LSCQNFALPCGERFGRTGLAVLIPEEAAMGPWERDCLLAEQFGAGEPAAVRDLAIRLLADDARLRNSLPGALRSQRGQVDYADSIVVGDSLWCVSEPSMGFSFRVTRGSQDGFGMTRTIRERTRRIPSIAPPGSTKTTARSRTPYSIPAGATSRPSRKEKFVAHFDA